MSLDSIPSPQEIHDALCWGTLAHRRRPSVSARLGSARLVVVVVVIRDLEKVFDRLDWNFIVDTLLDAGLPSGIRRIIMDSITSTSFQVQWNGSLSQTFQPQGGIRQVDCLGKYLGIPVLHMRARCSNYDFILDKMRNRLSRWVARSLFMAGRIVLANSTLLAIMIYFMQSTMLPKIVCLDIEKLIRKFIWGSSATVSKILLVNWEVLCQPRDHGGLDLRRVHDFNAAFILQVGFALITNAFSLWTRLLRENTGWLTSVRIQFLEPIVPLSGGHLLRNGRISSRVLLVSIVLTALQVKIELFSVGILSIPLTLVLVMLLGIRKIPSGIIFGKFKFPNVEESSIHVLRDCKEARAIWHLLLPHTLFHSFFNMSLQECFGRGGMTTDLHCWHLEQRNYMGYVLLWQFHASDISYFPPSKRQMEATKPRMALLECRCCHLFDINMVTDPNASRNPIFLVRLIGALRYNAWATDVVWVPRDCNKPADYFARIVQPNSLELILLSLPLAKETTLPEQDSLSHLLL
ncbi:hypothetical protein F3Y22_tig00002840pilonHSYRG00305 [Hibiscus syriacus]|uniref:Reverse transcriptase domain-containing protein n=1 Tax=Hibiscus syriacus TaxID=106335 RepID=A0A6A3CUJ7_HIBSY|nr:hypothetical protein F3Y22_tig00002840pilonHSYRG00305 [Hibiscus syriacus]